MEMHEPFWQEIHVEVWLKMETKTFKLFYN